MDRVIDRQAMRMAVTRGLDDPVVGGALEMLAATAPLVLERVLATVEPWGSATFPTELAIEELEYDCVTPPSAGTGAAELGARIRFPVSEHRVVNELALALLLQRMAGVLATVVVELVVPVPRSRTPLPVPPLPWARLRSVSVATLNGSMQPVAAFATCDGGALVWRRDVLYADPTSVTAVLVHHRSFDPEHCAGEAAVAELAAVPCPDAASLELALLVHELVSLAGHGCP